MTSVVEERRGARFVLFGGTALSLLGLAGVVVARVLGSPN